MDAKYFLKTKRIPNFMTVVHLVANIQNRYHLSLAVYTYIYDVGHMNWSYELILQNVVQLPGASPNAI